MKNLVRYQGEIWRNRTIENEFEKLTCKLDKTNSGTADFFSGILSSFVSTLLTMILISNQWVSNALLLIIVAVGVFIGLWLVISKLIMPLLEEWREQRKATLLSEADDNVVVNYFNTYISYSVLEMNEVVTVLSGTADNDCKIMNIVLTTREWIKIVVFLKNYIKKDRHIRTETTKSGIENVGKFINHYSYSSTIQMLAQVGDVLVEQIKNLPNDTVGKGLLAKDVGHYVEVIKNGGLPL